LRPIKPDALGARRERKRDIIAPLDVREKLNAHAVGGLIRSFRASRRLTAALQPSPDLGLAALFRGRIDRHSSAVAVNHDRRAGRNPLTDVVETNDGRNTE